MSFFSRLFGGGKTADLKVLIEQGAMLVDVREPAEFVGGSVRGAVNIPVGSITNRIAQFKNKKNIIVFCRSGNRSGQAKNILNQHGIKDVVNGGTWKDVNRFVH